MSQVVLSDFGNELFFLALVANKGGRVVGVIGIRLPQLKAVFPNEFNNTGPPSGAGSKVIDKMIVLKVGLLDLQPHDRSVPTKKWIPTNSVLVSNKCAKW